MQKGSIFGHMLRKPPLDSYKQSNLVCGQNEKVVDGFIIAPVRLAPICPGWTSEFLIIWRQ
eukprot:1141463-Pelagomonas_calceolata.AAC.7